MDCKDDFLKRRAILIQLEAASPASIPMETILIGLSCAAISTDLPNLRAILDYLEGKGYVELSCSKISAAHVRAKLTASGRDYLEGGDF